MNYRNLFQILSYLQYPLMLAALFFSAKPYFQGFDYLLNHSEIIFENYNYMLIFMGLGISFSTLQDTTKTQNNLSKKIWENPRKGKTMIGVMLVLTLATLLLGTIGYFFSANLALQHLALGLIVFGIGLINFLKTGLEVFENHRLDRKETAVSSS